MKKTLLAAALALGFAGVAQAETSVTLYGVLDTGIGYQKVEGANGVDHKRFGIVSGVQNGNRWGLRGTEDLGNGLQAIFQIESGFDIGTGAHQQGDRLFGRHATIGLQSDSWGRLDFGRQTNIASKYWNSVASPFGGSFNQAGIGSTFGQANTTRWDNMVMYQTPNFSGFQFGVGYSFNIDRGQVFDTDGVTDPNTKGITAGLRYANGPLAVALAYDQLKNDALEASTGTDKVQAWSIAASYDFEVIKLHAGFGQTRDGFINGGNHFGGFVRAETGRGVGRVGTNGDVFLEDYDANLYTLGVSAPLGGGEIMAAWNMADFDDIGGVDFEKQNIYSLGYTYALSKRTNVYAYGSYAKDLYGIDDTKSTTVGIGLRHRF